MSSWKVWQPQVTRSGENALMPPLTRPVSSPSPPPPPSLPTEHVTQFINCRIVRGNKLIREDLWLHNGRIIDPVDRFWTANKKYEFAADTIIDCNGAIIAPAYIDIQINGGFGVDFTKINLTTEKADVVRKGVLRDGVCAFMPTIITSTAEVYAHVNKLFAPKPGSTAGAGILGVHCEGPFIAVPGAHPQHLMQFTKTMTPEIIETIYGAENLGTAVRLITVAPEIEGMIDTIRAIKLKYAKQINTDSDQPHADNGVTSSRSSRLVISLGHSNATYDVAYRALENGATLLTHMFNAMIPFHHRDPGIIGILGAPPAILSRTFYSLICDGIHTHPASIKIAYSTHPDGIILVTDAIEAMGLNEGIYTLGDQLVVLERTLDGHRRAVVSGTNTLAGSVARMDECVRLFRHSTSCDIVHAINAASLHPAQLLGIENDYGSLHIGCRGDLILLNDDLDVKAMWMNGELAWQEDGVVQIKQVGRT